MKLIIQIPCFNEEATLGETLRDLPATVPGFDVVEVLVIDDGSTDRTVAVAREHGVHHVVSHVRNRGLAAAYMTGLRSALEAGADVIVNTDADNQYDGSCVPDLVRPIVDDGFDLVVGERPIESVDEFSAFKKRLQRVGSWVVRRFSGTPVRDAASGFRAVSADAAMRLQVFGRYTYTMETLIQAGWEGLAVTSVPISVNPVTRPSRLVRSIPQYVGRSAQTIIRSFVLYRPFRFFAYLGAVPFAIGVVLVLRWLGYFVFADEYESRLPGLLAGIGALLVAIQIWAVGFVADLQAANRRIMSAVRYEQRAQALGRLRPVPPIEGDRPIAS
jgi:glycosyltransferase involved in cell wall biosynthesis